MHAILAQVARARAEPGSGHDVQVKCCGHRLSNHAIVREPVVGPEGIEGENFRVECRAKVELPGEELSGTDVYDMCGCARIELP